ncbi:DUF2490 domain-containing protein [Cyclobacterium jeungdonense]|uniref:DUF2490 domain-containing protein n=1 Tax=Cyclobacterium jeungdonense TaxID=708087 RepID=A0ABT8CEY5_9BACT|nr:DUF2490 domain-containing protein [Cyclobacterium jeungdonense]MDN3690757.1 DUF2490 domain-containing protein [Cyclobacterium jeungdonense]
MRRLILVFVWMFLSYQGVAQNRLTNLGFFPELQVRVHAGDNLKLTGKIESQHGMATMPEGSEASWGYRHVQTDFQAFAGTSLNPYVSLTGGYQYRLDGDNEDSHRAIQQISFLQRKDSYRIGHRIRADETFAVNEAIEYRLRYRLSFEIPLEGQSLDPGEVYLVVSDEPIFSYQDGETGFENRFAAALGHLSLQKQKFQAGIDYRTDRFFNADLRQRIWFKFGWYLTL